AATVDRIDRTLAIGADDAHAAGRREGEAAVGQADVLFVVREDERARAALLIGRDQRVDLHRLLVDDERQRVEVLLPASRRQRQGVGVAALTRQFSREVAREVTAAREEQRRTGVAAALGHVGHVHLLVGRDVGVDLLAVRDELLLLGRGIRPAHAARLLDEQTAALGGRLAEDAALIGLGDVGGEVADGRVAALHAGGQLIGRRGLRRRRQQDRGEHRGQDREAEGARHRSRYS